jgi:predicted kinase
MIEIIAYITVGLIGAGKSFWAREKVLQDQKNGIKTLIVNGDAVREMIYGKYEFKEEMEPIVNSLLMRDIETITTAGCNIIIDEMLMTLTASKRKSLIRLLKYHGVNKIVTVTFDSSIEKLQRRITNDNRGYDAARWQRVYDECIAFYDPFIADDEGHDFVIEVK